VYRRPVALTSIQLIDYAGMAFLAASGAVAAAERREDAVTFIFFGCFTGMGGGTLRDLLIGAPVFWVAKPDYLLVSVIASLTVWVWPMRWTSHKALLWLDAVGLAAYATVGTSKAFGLGLAPSVCVAMGVITACFGGILRDTLAGQPSMLLQRNIYVTAAIAAASADALGLIAGLGIMGAAVIGGTVGFALRAGALLWGWRLPQFKPM
jgi:uncharacterized membrane protein YeiH